MTTASSVKPSVVWDRDIDGRKLISAVFYNNTLQGMWSPWLRRDQVANYLFREGTGDRYVIYWPAVPGKLIARDWDKYIIHKIGGRE